MEMQKYEHGSTEMEIRNQSTEAGVRKTVVRKPEYGNWSTETVSVLQCFLLPPRSRALQTTHMHAHTYAHTLWYSKRGYQG